MKLKYLKKKYTLSFQFPTFIAGDIKQKYRDIDIFKRSSMAAQPPWKTYNELIPKFFKKL